MSIRLLVTDPNEQMRQFVHLLNQSADHLKTAIKYCLCARRTAGWSFCDRPARSRFCMVFVSC